MLGRRCLIRGEHFLSLFHWLSGPASVFSEVDLVRRRRRRRKRKGTRREVGLEGRGREKDEREGEGGREGGESWKEG